MIHRTLRHAPARIAALLALATLSACAALMPPSPTPTNPPEPTFTETPSATATQTPPPPTATLTPSLTPTRTPTRFATSRIPSATVPVTRTQGPTRVPLPTSDLGGLPNLCELVPAQEVEALAGEAVLSATPSQGSCLYIFARPGPDYERAMSTGVFRDDEAKDALVSIVLLLGVLRGAEYAYTLADELEQQAPTMTLIELGEATAKALERLSYVAEEIPGTGEWAIWFLHPDPPLGILLAVQDDTLVLVAEAGMEEPAARDASAGLAELLLIRLPPEF